MCTESYLCKICVSLTRWTWVLANSGSWWWTGKPGVLQSVGLQRVSHNWATELNCALKTTKTFQKEIKEEPSPWKNMSCSWILRHNTVEKVLGPTTDSPTWNLAKILRTSRKFYFGGQWNLITELTQDWGNRFLEDTNKILCTRTQDKGAETPTRDGPDLPVSVQEFLVEV